MDLDLWLRNLGLQRYLQSFRDNDIDFESLRTLTNEDLKDIGVELVGHRRKLLNAIGELGRQESDRAATQPIQPIRAKQSRTDEVTLPGGAADPPKPEALTTAERRQLTVMFVDLVGSTKLSRTTDPEQLREILRDYQNAVAGEIARFSGHVAKYMGDGVLAYFGWPAAHENEAERAVRSGLAIIERISQLGSQHALSARIGIATGLVVVGDLIGAGSAKEATVFGETPNLAARLQSIAEPATIIVSELTYRLLGRLFEMAPIDAPTLRGFDEPVRAYRVLGEGQVEGRFEALRAAEESPFVGREVEIGLLVERWDSAAEGEGQVVVLCGEPGIGKSRILRELREKLESRPHARIRYFGSAYHTQSGLYPVFAHLQRAAGMARNDPPGRKLQLLRQHVTRWNSAPEEALPLLASALGLPLEGRSPVLDLAPQRQRERIFEVLIEQVERASRERPILMLVEDAHWLDPTSDEWFDRLVGRIDKLPILIVATTRPEGQARWSGFPNMTSLTLNRLSQSHTRAIIGNLTRGLGLPPSVIERIVSRTEGVPLFTEELTKTVLEAGLLQRGEASFELITELPPLAIPATLQDSLMARLDQLEPVKDIVSTGAVIGREFAHELLAAVTQLSADELERATGQLLSAGLVFRRIVDGQVSYTFRHALLQEAAYNSLLISRRQQLHARVAHALERQFPETVVSDPQLLGLHFAQAGLMEKAVDYYERAGRQALARSALTESLAYFERALDQLHTLPPSRDKTLREMRLNMALGNAHIAASGFAAKSTGNAYKRARQCCDEAGDIPEVFPIVYGLCLFHLYRAQLEEAGAAAAQLISFAGKTNDRGLLFFAHRAGGVAAWPAGKFTEARQHLEQAIAFYDPTEHRVPFFVYAFDPRVVCLDYLARTLLPLGFPDKALATNSAAIAEATALSHRNSLALPLFYGGVLRQILGDRDGVRRNSAALLQNVNAAGFRMWEAAAAILLGWLTAEDGQLDVGQQEIKKGVEGWRMTGAEMMVPYFLALEAQIELKRDRVTAAQGLLEEARTCIRQTGEFWFAAEIARLQGEATLARRPNRVDEARAYYAEAASIAAGQRAQFWELRALLAAEQLDNTDARKKIAQLYHSLDPHSNSEISEFKRAGEIASAVG